MRRRRRPRRPRNVRCENYDDDNNEWMCMCGDIFLISPPSIHWTYIIIMMIKLIAQIVFTPIIMTLGYMEMVAHKSWGGSEDWRWMRWIECLSVKEGPLPRSHKSVIIHAMNCIIGHSKIDGIGDEAAYSKWSRTPPPPPSLERRESCCLALGLYYYRSISTFIVTILFSTFISYWIVLD